MADSVPSSIPVSTGFQYHFSETEDLVFKAIDKPHDLNKKFFIEVVKNLKDDFGLIYNTFLQSKGFGSLKKLSIEIAGNETHYGGKVALYIILIDNEERAIKILYKPRSVEPDFYLEELLNEVSQQFDTKRETSRAILPIPDKSYGYDTYVEGKPLSKEDAAPEINELMAKYEINRIILSLLNQESTMMMRSLLLKFLCFGLIQ